MKIIALIPVLAVLLCACAHAPATRFSAAPEEITVEGSGKYDARDLAASRSGAVLDALRAAVRRTSHLYMDEAARAEKYQVFEAGILKEPGRYIAKQKIISEGPDGGSYRVVLRAWVYHAKLAGELAGLGLAGQTASGPRAALVRKSGEDSFFTSFREAFSRRSPVTIADFPFAGDPALLAGPDSALLSAASQAGADLLICASATVAAAGSGLNVGFYPSKAEAAARIYDARSGRLLLDVSSRSDAIDATEAASFAKALAAAGEQLAQDAALKLERRLDSGISIRLKVYGVAGLEGLEKLKAQLLRLNLNALRLESYSEGTAVFYASPDKPDPQEFASAVLRGDSLGLELEGTGPQEAVFSLPR